MFLKLTRKRSKFLLNCDMHSVQPIMSFYRQPSSCKCSCNQVKINSQVEGKTTPKAKPFCWPTENYYKSHKVSESYWCISEAVSRLDRSKELMPLEPPYEPPLWKETSAVWILIFGRLARAWEITEREEILRAAFISKMHISFYRGNCWHKFFRSEIWYCDLQLGTSWCDT